MIPFSLWSEALWCGQEVIGELRHERAIRSLFDGPIPSRGVDLDTMADLVPEFDNRFDPFAVSVRVNDRVIGYLPREDARYYHPVLADLVGQDLQPQVPCHIWASEWKPVDWERRDDDLVEFHASVAIALGQPHMLVPVNLPPKSCHELLPPGAAVRVDSRPEDADAVAPHLRPEGECWVYATLHAVAEADAPAQKLVEVRIDGRRVGRLADRIGAEYLPAISYLADTETVVRAIVRGNRLMTEVVLHAARTHELPATWPDGLARFPVPPTRHYLAGQA